MAWLEDGTFGYSKDKLKKEFPIVATPNLRLSKNRKRIAIINDFESGSFEYELADPKIDEELEDYVFFHVFLGEDAAIAKGTIDTFLTNTYNEKSDSIVLFRKEPGRLFMYSYGIICTSFPTVLDGPHVEDGVYFLPLKRYLFECPVCGHRTLPHRGEYMICTECGWEDEGIDGDNAKSLGANGDYTIKQYRLEYLKIKEKNPDYSWDKSRINYNT